MDKLIIYYLIAINVILFLIMGIDKHLAIAHKYRVTEKVLFIAAAIGGSFGGICAMLIFRHKTKHVRFLYGFSAMFLCQVIMCSFIPK